MILRSLTLVVIASYIAAQMISDIASLKIGSIFGMAVDLGTFIYPITFTLRDVVHRLVGKRAARTVIWTAAGVNAVMAAFFWLCSLVPPHESWPLNAEFAAILSPVWNIVIASIIAELASELLDTEVYSWFVRRITTRHRWLRVLVSNAVSIPVDSVIFCAIAFGFTIPLADVAQIVVMNILLKFAVTLLSLPLIYLGKSGPQEPHASH